MGLMSTTESIQQLRDVLGLAVGLLITTGAGMGVYSAIAT
jgi:hypothetical protein